MTDEDDESLNEDLKFFVFGLAFIMLMALIALWFFTYDFPGGEVSVWGFIAVFFRELIALFVVVLAMGLIVLEKLKR